MIARDPAMREKVALNEAGAQLWGLVVRGRSREAQGEPLGDVLSGGIVEPISLLQHGFDSPTGLTWWRVKV
jgi:hypothetical protein